MSGFLKRALTLLQTSKRENGKEKGKANETSSTPNTEQPSDIGNAEMGKRRGEGEKEKTEMKLKDKGKLFVGGLSQQTTAEGLKACFSRFGSVLHAVVMKNSDNSKSRGYGFVTFADPMSAEVALKTETHILDGKAVDIRAYESNRRALSAQRRKDRRLFLGGMPVDVKEEDLRTFFSRYGKVTDVVIPHSRKTRKPKGFAFLTFEDKQAAEKCLSESFVHLGNRRVLIKKATARDRSLGSLADADVEEALECCGSDLESAASCGDDVASLPEDDSHSSTTSGDRTSLFEQFPGFLNVFENYFLSKIARNQMEAKEAEQKWETPDKDRREMEKLEARFLIEASLGFCGEGENQDEEDDEDDDNSLLLEKGSALDALSAKFTEVVMQKTFKNITQEIPNLKSSDHENRLVADLNKQKCFVPFIIRDELGALRCSVCHWAPPDGSCETFLAHCNAPLHKLKIKERFASENIQEGKTEIKGTGLSREIDRRVISSETEYNRLQKEVPGKQHEIRAKSSKQLKKKHSLLDQQIPQLRKQQQKQKEKLLQADQPIPLRQQEQKEKKKGKSENSSQNLKIKGENNQRKIPNLKVHALAKGMVCIQPLSPHELSCTMCNKMIPKAPDFGALMKNVSSHLQSKRHLKKLEETENSLKNALSENSVQNDDSDQKYISGKNEMGKKTKEALQKEVGNNCEKTTPDKKVPKGAPKTNFLCLFCNYSANGQQLFNAHMNSKVHSDSLNKINAKPFDFGPNSVLCMGCNRYLHGSLYDINKHHSKCSVKK